MTEYHQYWNAALAAQLAQSDEDRVYVSGAFEKLVGEDGLNLGEEAEGLVRGVQASEKATSIAIQTYHGAFERKRNEKNVEDLMDQYNDIFEKLDPDDRNKIEEEYGRHSGQTLGHIKEESRKAKYILEDPTGTFTDEQKEQARATLEGYKGINTIIPFLDRYKLESLRAGAVNATCKLEGKDLASKLQ